MLTHPSTELVARALCQLRRAHARSVRVARARLRQQRRLEVDKTRKRGVQTGGPTGAVERRRRWLYFFPLLPLYWLFFSRGRLPLTVVNWGSIFGEVPSHRASAQHLLENFMRLAAAEPPHPTGP